MLPLSGTIWLQRSSHTRSKPFRRGPSASFTLAHTTCRIQVPSSYSWPAYHVRPQGPTCQKIIQIHNPAHILLTYYITFLPLLGNIHLSLDYESPQNFLASPLQPKNTNHSFHMLSPISDFIMFFQCRPIYCFFVFVCLCLLSTILFSLWLLLPINDYEVGTPHVTSF